MADESENTPQVEPPAVVRQIPVIYFNTAEAHATEYEVSLDLGLRTGEATEPAVRMVSTWEHAKSLHYLLGRMIERYEKDIGPIRDIEDIKRKHDDEAKEGASE